MSFSAGSPLARTELSRDLSGGSSFSTSSNETGHGGSGMFSPNAAGHAAPQEAGCGPSCVREESPDQLLSQQITEQLSEAFLAGLPRSTPGVGPSAEALASSKPIVAAATASRASAGSGGGDSPRGTWSLGGMLEHNHAFVQQKSYEPFLTNRFPDKKLVIITCMDTRLTHMLPAALGLKNGDAKIIKVAGSIVAHPFGSVMRSILVAVYALGAEHVLVIGHHDCGMTGLDPSKILNAAKAHGIPDTTFKTLQAAGLNLESWLSGFSSVQTSVQHSVDTIRNHPLLHCHEGAHSRKTSSADHVVAPAEAAATTTKPRITVTGFVICPTTGKLDLVTEAGRDIADLLKRQAEETKEQPQQVRPKDEAH